MDHEQDLLKQKACMVYFTAHATPIEKISRLSLVFKYFPNEPEVNALLKELIDNGTLIAPVDGKQIDAVRKNLETALCDKLIEFYAANGHSDDAQLRELIPIGTFIKLKKMIEESKAAVEKANAPAELVIERIC